MRTFTIRSAFAGISVMMLAGCGQAIGSNPAMTTSEDSSVRTPSTSTQELLSAGSTHSNASPKNNGLYVTELIEGQHSGGQVVVYGANYRKNPTPLCSIPVAYPNAIAADSSANMYVLNSPFSSATQLLVYGPQCGSQSAVITDSYGYGTSLASHGSTWYIGNSINSSHEPPGNVAVCSVSAGCAADLTDDPSNPFTGDMFGVGVDKKGNVYGDGYTGSGAGTGLSIIEWAHGKNPGHVIYTVPHSDLDDSGGQLLIDKSGNFLVGGQDQFLVLSGCPSNCQTVLFELGMNQFALNKLSTRFFATNSQGSVDVYAYDGPNQPVYKYSVTNGLGKVSTGVSPYAVAPVPDDSR